MLYLAFVHVNKQVRILIKQVQIFTIQNTMTHYYVNVDMLCMFEDKLS